MSKDKLHLVSKESHKALFDDLYPSLCLFANRYLRMWFKKYLLKLGNVKFTTQTTMPLNRFCINPLETDVSTTLKVSITEV